MDIRCEPRFLFGLRSDVRNNVHFVEDNVVVYPAGHNIVVYLMTEKT